MFSANKIIFSSLENSWWGGIHLITLTASPEQNHFSLFMSMNTGHSNLLKTTDANSAVCYTGSFHKRWFQSLCK